MSFPTSDTPYNEDLDHKSYWLCFRFVYLFFCICVTALFCLLFLCVFVFVFLHLPGEFDHESYWGAGPVFASCDREAFSVSSDGGEVFLNHYRHDICFSDRCWLELL